MHDPASCVRNGTAPPVSPGKSGPEVDPVLAEIVHDVIERARRGDAVDLESLCRKHPGHAAQLRDLLPTVQALAVLEVTAESGMPRPVESRADSCDRGGPVVTEEMIGDFQILHEIGRGGMGIVYEARQVSLQRRVALKVLPFAAALDPQALSRFRQESLAAAQLDHPHIVPVYGVGADRGVHYYAMRYIEGRSLAQVIAEMKGGLEEVENSKSSKRHDQGAGRSADCRMPLDSQNPAAVPSAAFRLPDLPDPKPATTIPGFPSTLARNAAGISTHRDVNRLEYHRAIARIGREAAEALDFAHAHGVLHRDVKPGNLLIDEKGDVWITDFGLARLETGDTLTHTGDLLGTLRYMSPEQALGKRGLIDQRTDVYSLGVTLYELLTLQPPFAATDKADLLRQIDGDDPLPLRQIDRAVPRELETIVLKCVEKEPARRYTTARELADDLGRFLAHEPIMARPSSSAERLVKWGRRHKPFVYAAAIVLVVLGLAGLGVNFDRSKRRAAATAAVSQALEEAVLKGGAARARPEDLSAWEAAIAAARRALALADASQIGGELRQSAARVCRQLEQQEQELRGRLAEADRDRRMLDACEAARLEWLDFMNSRIDRMAMANAFAQAFREYGIDPAATPAEDAAQQICGRPIRQQLVFAILEWRFALNDEKDALGEKLLSVAESAAAGPPWEKALIVALRQDAACAALARMAAETELPRAALVVVCELLFTRDRTDSWTNSSIAVLSRAQRLYPDDFWTNELLGIMVLGDKQRQVADAVPYLLAAVALRPNSPKARLALGVAQFRLGRLDEAVDALRMALHLNGDYADAHNKLGAVFLKQGRLDDAIEEVQLAVQLKGDDAESHNNLGTALIMKGHLDDAIGEFRRSVELKPGYESALNNLGSALILKGRFDEAIAALRQSLELKPESADLHNNLGNALRHQERLNEAITEYRRALELQPNHADAHHGLGRAFARLRRFDDAIVEYRRALELKREHIDAHTNLGLALRDQGRLDEAIAEFQEALALSPDNAPARHILGTTLRSMGRLDDAIAELRRTTEIQPTYAPAHFSLFSALRRKGAFAEMLEAVQRFDRLGAADPKRPYPTKKWIHETERLIHLNERFPQVLDGDDHPADAEEQAALAAVALEARHRAATAANWYRQAFAQAPSLAEDLLENRRYNAARAAVLAAAETQSEALSEEERAKWRREALDWLRADLDAVRRLAQKAPHLRPALVEKVDYWQRDHDLASIRDADQLNALPDVERHEFEALWSEVKAALQQMAPPPTDNASP
jgi:serine/threonine protein kinase/Flp pilus assembly protein TadD